MTDHPMGETVKTAPQIDDKKHEESTTTVPAAAESRARKSRVPEVIVAALLLAGGLVVAVNVISSASEKVAQEIDERQAEIDGEAAYYDVMLNRVAVNGERGTQKWRAYYRNALTRVLGSHDFSDSCADNGFLKEGPSAHTLPCIAVGDIRAVRTPDGTVRYFKEETSARLTIELDVMEQDVHAPDYLDIDKFSTAIGDRARRIVQEAEDRKRTKERAEQAASLEETRRLIADSNRIVAETERLLGRWLLPVAPPSDLEQGQGRP